MSEAIWLFMATCLSLVGMGWLALAMDVHWGQVMHRPPEQALTQRMGLRWAGAAALLLSLLSCLSADRPSMAVLVWVLLLAVSAFTVALVLSRRPRCLARLVPGLDGTSAQT
jgi:hypothetical protein